MCVSLRCFGSACWEGAHSQLAFSPTRIPRSGSDRGNVALPHLCLSVPARPLVRNLALLLDIGVQFSMALAVPQHVSKEHGVIQVTYVHHARGKRRQILLRRSRPRLTAALAEIEHIIV